MLRQATAAAAAEGDAAAAVGGSWYLQHVEPEDAEDDQEERRLGQALPDLLLATIHEGVSSCCP